MENISWLCATLSLSYPYGKGEPNRQTHIFMIRAIVIKCPLYQFSFIRSIWNPLKIEK